MPKIVPTVRGMKDILPQDIAAWTNLEKKAVEVFAAYGYRQVRTPILEHEQLFLRPVGKDTDIVQKELFRSVTGDNAVLCLRPEGTVAVARALAQAGMLRNATQRVWYMGPMFRHERPQQGRQRQFHQFGAEVLGETSPAIDAEIILLCWRIWQHLGITSKIRLQINNLGMPNERMEYRTALQEFLRKHKAKLSKTDQERINTNPLRVLDSKSPAVQELLAEMPLLHAKLGSDSRRHYEQVLELLSRHAVPFTENAWLVRGLDYYNLTVFEWENTAIAGRQNTIAGGGRYDGLLEMIGASPSPGIGMAAGIERILPLCAGSVTPDKNDIFLAATTEGSDIGALLKLSEQFRASGYSVLMHPRKGTIRKILKHAYASLSHHAIIIGPQEKANETATVKPLHTQSEQFTISMQNPVSDFKQALDRLSLDTP